METLLTVGSFVGHLSPLTVLFISVLVLVILLGALLIVQLRNNAHLYNLTYPVYDYTVKEAEKRGNQIIAEAQEKGREIITAAETEAAKLGGERMRESEHLMTEYEKRLQELMHTHESALKTYTGSAQTSFEALSSGFKKNIETIEKSIEQGLQNFAHEAGETRTSLEAETKRLIAEHIEKEFVSVREGLQTYRKERMKHVEADIVAIVEQAVAIVLRKELPLKEHADLVYQALEEAKREGTFV